MESFHFDKEFAHPITAYGSRGATVVPLLRAPVSVVTIYLEPGGHLGSHPAAADQLFLVVAGSGEATAGGERRSLSPGIAILWHKEEEHKTRAGPAGLTAVIVEGDGLAASP